MTGPLADGRRYPERPFKDRTESRSARVGSTGTAADAASNNGSLSATYETQRQKVNGGAVD